MANPPISEVPDLMKIWDRERNEYLGHDPTKITSGTGKRLWFLCVNGLDHSFLSKPSNIAIGQRCGVCVGRQVHRGFNDFEHNFPYESYFWDIHKNECNPWEVSSRSNRRFHFICEEGHPFEATLNNIGCHNAWCPYCAGKRVWKGLNDFESNFTYESYFWDYHKNQDNPWEVSKGSHTKFWFTCENGHSFDARLYNIGRGKWCPYCRPKWSKAEKEMYYWIKYTLLPRTEVVPNARGTLPGGKEIDIYIPSLKLGFEYNGNYWHKDKGDPDGPSAQKERLAREKGVTLYTIWEDDWTSDRSTWEEFIVRTINLTQK